ncbi:N-terminal Xaa-Pro-Lys N-methyltransferase 1 [Brachionus plicatilis]|uniref:Alpha N-terminal protein methyltransferase 1 n=1 Tax=Brachionus plicatilis TaxID=10195 RepID=A0A3M7QNW6_BRAPC|nr:N-terminal Xaa-Pro-Lys N-methyltransferase 1 [Brachionus plicatilis]
MNAEKKMKFYELSEDYWAKQPATVNGMLGGFDFVSQADIDQSQSVLDWLKSSKKLGETKLALDCGAGIGRITKNLLLNNFESVEMVDVTEGFISKAKEYLDMDSARVVKFHVCALQNFHPEVNRYDCIWIQWVLGYLTDADLVDFLKRCKLALKQNGICVIKENLSKDEREFDEEDSSYTRTKSEFVNIIHKAGWRLVKDEKQRNFPKELYEVRIFVLQ